MGIHGLSLDPLRSRMVDFDKLHGRKLLVQAERQRVEPTANDHHLTHAFLQRLPRHIFKIALSNDVMQLNARDRKTLQDRDEQSGNRSHPTEQPIRQTGVSLYKTCTHLDGSRWDQIADQPIAGQIDHTSRDHIGCRTRGVLFHNLGSTYVRR